MRFCLQIAEEGSKLIDPGLESRWTNTFGSSHGKYSLHYFIRQTNKQAEKQSKGFHLEWESAGKQTVFLNVSGRNNVVPTVGCDIRVRFQWWPRLTMGWGWG